MDGKQAVLEAMEKEALRIREEILEAELLHRLLGVVGAVESKGIG